MVPFDVVTDTDYMVSQSGSVTILCESLEIFSLLIMWLSFRFTHVERITVLTTSPVHYFRSLRAAKTVFVWKEITPRLTKPKNLLPQDLTRHARTSLWEPKKGKTKNISFLGTVAIGSEDIVLLSVQNMINVITKHASRVTILKKSFL